MADIQIVELDEILAHLGIEQTEDNIRDQRLVEESLISAIGAVRTFLHYDPVRKQRVEYYPRTENYSLSTGVWEVDDTRAYLRQDSATSRELQLTHLPIRSIDELKVDYDGRFGAKSGSFGSTTIWTNGSDYWPSYDGVDDAGNKICRDGLIRCEGSWPGNPGSIKVTYTAGYSADEFKGDKALVNARPIYEVVLSESVRRFLTAKRRVKSRGGFRGPLASENLGEYSYSIDSSAWGKLLSGSLAVESVEKLSPFANQGVCIAV